MSDRSAYDIQKVSTDISIDLTPSKLPLNSAKRIFMGVFGQKKRTHICPDIPQLDGKKALVTGGLAGVGEFISRGLLDRGADVTTMSRGKSQSSGKISGITRLNVDLADPETIVTAIDHLDCVPFDLLICNSGLLLPKDERVVTGIEKTFAINVLGHHVLYRLLIERGLLAPNARIVITTGDIYSTESECSPFIPFETTSKTYARSKLGNLWQVAELTRRYPDLHSVAIHPGVIASGFAGSKTGFLAWLRGKLLISEQAGAQSALIAATQDLPRGSYWHNVFGLVNLPVDDPALNHGAAKKLWDQLEHFSAPFLTESEQKAVRYE